MTKNLILNENQNVNEPTYFEQNTPLHLAVLNNHYLEVRLLLKNNADPNLKNKDGILPFEYASLMSTPIQKLFKESKDLDRDTFDLREIIRKLINKPDNIVNSTVCEKNHHLRVWTANDFNEKINKELKK